MLLKLWYRRLKVFILRQPEQVEMRKGTETAEIINDLEMEVEDLQIEVKRANRETTNTARELGGVIDSLKIKHNVQVDTLAATVEHLTQALSHTSVHFKTIDRTKKVATP